MKTDSQLQQDVIAELEWDRSVPSVGIGVTASDGVVTLAGEVGSPAGKLNAERAAQRVSGVKALVDEMTVNLPPPSQRADADIARSAQSVLAWSSAVPADAVRVAVENAWVTLSGQVDWQYQRRAAEDMVRHLLGVAGVNDQITLSPTVSRIAVKAEIEAALKRRAADDAHTISVDVRGADVTLTGTVRSWAERELAVHSAWNMAGVQSVVDRLTLEH